MPSGFLRTSSTVRGGVTTMENRPVSACVSLTAPPSKMRSSQRTWNERVRGAHHAGDLDGDGLAADAGERIVVAGVLVEGDGGAVGDEVVGLEPVLPHDHRIDRQRAHVVDEARQVEGDLRVARLVGLGRRADRARAAARVDLDDVGHGRSGRGRARAGSPARISDSSQASPAPSGASCGPARGRVPMRSSQTWAAF